MSMWDTESGLLDEYTATVESAYFATDIKYRDGEVPMLHLELVNIESESGDSVPDTLTEKFPVGNGWMVVDNGERIEREDGNVKRKVHQSTRYGMLINHLKALPDLLADLDAAKLGPLDAASFIGRRFHFVREEKDYGTINGELVGVKSFIMIDGYVGTDGATSNGNGHGDLEEQLKAIAAESSNHSDFVSRAMTVPGVTGDTALLERVTDASDSGFYASSSN